ncbi:hypothetical protein D3C86_1063890 [compost metagenome]
MCAAAVAARVDRDDGTTTRIAAQQAAEQGGVRSTARRVAALEFLRSRLAPKRRVDDAQLRRFTHQPFFARPCDRKALARVWIFQPLAAIPHEPADVHLVIEQAVSHLRVAHQRTGGPAIAARARHALRVQGVDDAAQRGAGGNLLVDPPHMLRLLFVDHDAVAAFYGHARVSVGAPAGGHAALELPLQAAVRLLAQVVDVQLIHQPARDAHHLAAGLLGVVPVGGADDSDTAVLHALYRALLLGQVARDAVQPLDDQHVEAVGQCVGQQRLATGSQRHWRRAADSFVGVHHCDGPALSGCSLAASPQLIFDAVLALVISAVSGVQAGSHGALW